MAKKSISLPEYQEVVYDIDRWILMRRFRSETLRTMEALEKFQLETIVHGSIARGDVTEQSDIDVFIPSQTSSFIVETALERAGVVTNRRVLVQATPTYAMKAYIEIGDNTAVSFPLMKMRRVEREFYRFGGEATINTLSDEKRVPGVNKHLMLIEPSDEGHRESSIVGHEEHLTRLLGIGLETVLDRVHALLRRDAIGRTGVFIKRELTGDENFEMVMKRLADQNPAVRRRLRIL